MCSAEHQGNVLGTCALGALASIFTQVLADISLLRHFHVCLSLSLFHPRGCSTAFLQSSRETNLNYPREAEKQEMRSLHAELLHRGNPCLPGCRPRGLTHPGRIQNLMERPCDNGHDRLRSSLMPLGAVVEQVSCLCSLHVPRASTAGHLGPVLPDCGTHPAGGQGPTSAVATSARSNLSNNFPSKTIFLFNCLLSS